MEIFDGVQTQNCHKRRRQRLDGADFEPHRFFLLRTPLLPFDELEAWSAGLRAPGALGDPAALEAALDADRKELRGWLRTLLTRPVVIEALHIASPALVDALDEWRRDPDSKKGRRAEESLVRYAIRMAARATPFGMFAGCSVGRVGAVSRLQLAPQSSYRRHSRLDMGYLFSLAEELNADRDLRRSLRYRPSTSLYRAAGRLRYAEARYSGKDVDYHLVVVEPDEFLETALARAAGGATPGEIAAAVAASDPDGEISVDEAEGYVHELIDSQILVSELWPALTGPEAVHGFIETLERIPTPAAGATADTLRRVREALEELDRNGLGANPRRYDEISGGLEPLPQRADRRRLYQVDLFKPGDITLDPAVIDEIARGVEVLHRFMPPLFAESLEKFSKSFVERYGVRRFVPLVEAVDDEAGVGLPAATIGADNSPLLQGLGFSRSESSGMALWGAREDLLLRKLMRAESDGAQEIVIEDDDLEHLAASKRVPLPDAFQTWVRIAAADGEALAAGDFRVWVKTAFGPSGARVSGRFCHGDAEIACSVAEHLRVEEALDPDAIYAEVVHVASGRLGNVASRPVLREYEIPYLGVSGAPPERQIPIQDLLVTVDESFQIILYSKHLRRRVVPRLTTAHNFGFGSLAVYRFLGMMQSQGVRSGVNWQWRRPFERLPFLPRVRCGRAILNRAQWQVTPEEIRDLAARRGADRYAAVQQWRERRRIPRHIVLGEDDMELPLDLDNVLSLDVFLADARKRAGAVTLMEFWPGGGALAVRGPEGRFTDELMLTFARNRTPTRRQAWAFRDDAARVFPPASSWLYLKLYTGTATADGVLREVIAPLASRAMESGAAQRWFFLRYNDPQNHLRVRFGGEPARLRAVVDWLPEFLDPLLRDGRISKWQLDTYEREVERYGGPEAMEISEEIFHADSEAVLAALDELEGDRGADWRWRLALVGCDRLLADFGFDLARRRDLMARLRRGFGDEFSVGAELTQQLAQRLRETGDELYALLTAGISPEHPMAGSLAALDRRSAALAPLVAQLRALESEGRLTAPIDALVTSYLHMFVNRLIRSDARAHELVLYDLLHRLTVSRLARTPAAPAAPTLRETDPTPAPAS